MTREQLQQVRGALKAVKLYLWFTALRAPEATQHGLEVCDDALAILDAELAKPEIREWGVRYIAGDVWDAEKNGGYHIRSEGEARRMAADRPSTYSLVSRVAESRIPAGPWEPAWRVLVAYQWSSQKAGSVAQESGEVICND